MQINEQLPQDPFFTAELSRRAADRVGRLFWEGTDSSREQEILDIISSELKQIRQESFISIRQLAEMTKIDIMRIVFLEHGLTTREETLQALPSWTGALGEDPEKYEHQLR